MSNNKPLVWLALIVAFILSVWLAIVVGKYEISWPIILDVIFQTNFFIDNQSTEFQAIHNVIWQIRLPRLLGAIVIGAGLAVAGAAYQSMFRNPLVSPDILGVSAGAGLGAVIGIVSKQAIFITQALAFSGGLIAVFLVYLIAKNIKNRDPLLVLVLAGVAISAFITALISLIAVLSDPYSELLSITFWLLGGIGGTSLSEIVTVLPLVFIAFIPLIVYSWRINVLSLPEDEARALGLDVVRLRLLLIVCATLITSSVVSFAGIVAWVGLLIPHAARMLIGSDFTKLLPTSILLGATFMLITDTMARSISFIELPLGVITSIFGAPFFVLLLARSAR